MRGSAILLAAAVLTCHAAPAAADVQAVGTIELPGRDPTSLALYEPGNRILVADDDAGQLLILDGATHQQLAEAPVGGSPLAIAVNETHARAYVVSPLRGFTTGLTYGNGLVAVVDVKTGTAGTPVDPVPGPGVASHLVLGSDEVRDKVYVGHFASFDGGLGVIDVAADPSKLNPIAGAPAPSTHTDKIVVNAVTNEVLYLTGPNRLAIVDGDTHAVQFFNFDPTGGRSALDLAVSEPENKAYVQMVFVPGQAEPGILIYDRDTGGHKFVGRSDLGPLAFNQRTNRLFSGVQVGTVAGIVEGPSDVFTPISFPTGGVGALDVREASDNAFMSSLDATYVVNGATKCVQRFASGVPPRGGIVAYSAAVNETTGRAYIVNDQEAKRIAVFQDGEVACAAPGVPGGGVRPPGGGAPDRSAPRMSLVMARSQRMSRRRSVVLEVGCSEDCTVSARGSVSVPRTARVVRFRSARARIPAGGKRRVRLRLKRADLRAVRRALRRGKRLTARITIAATDRAGNSRRAARRVRLTR